MRERARRRREESLRADPSLAQDLLGGDEAASGEQAADGPAPADVVSSERTADDADLGRLLAEHAPRAHVPWVTAVLVGAILLTAGYVAGGYRYSHKGSGSTRAQATGGLSGFGGAGGVAGFGGNGNRAGRTGNGQGATPSAAGTGATGGTGSTGQGGGFGGGAGGGATIGTVKLVDGNNVYLTDTSGATVKVTLAKGAKVTVSQEGTLSDLAPGSTVVVVGKAGSDGTVTATSVSQGGGFGARQGAGAGG